MTGTARLLLRSSAPRPLVVTAVGGTAARLAVERVLRERGLRRALSPGEADTMVECCPMGAGSDAAVERVWDQMGEPRTRVRVCAADEAAARLDEARAALLDCPEQLRAAGRRAVSDADGGGEAGEGARGSGGDGGGSENRAEHGGHGEHGGSEHGREHEHEHGHGGMELPGGLAMADRGADRDGLKLDRLHIAIGPVQAGWPAGLVAELTVQGDVVQEARVSTLPPPADRITPFWGDPSHTGAETPAERVRAAAAADSLQRFLDLAGWPTAAATGRLLRDTLLVPNTQVTGRLRFTRWLRRVRGSRLLGWSLRGLGRAPDDLPDRLRGDVLARAGRWLDEIAAVVLPDTYDTFLTPPIRRGRGWRRALTGSGAGRAGRPAPGTAAGGHGRRQSAAPGEPPSRVPTGSDEPAEPSAPSPRPPLGAERAECARAAVEVLPGLLAGQELAAVRLIVASFDPDVEALTAYPPVHPSGGPGRRRPGGPPAARLNQLPPGAGDSHG